MELAQVGELLRVGVPIGFGALRVFRGLSQFVGVNGKFVLQLINAKG